MSTRGESKLEALIRLLADDGPYGSVIEKHLSRAGADAIPHLSRATRSGHRRIRSRATALLGQIRFDLLKDDFRRYWALPDGKMDLETGVFLIARYAYPDVSTSRYSALLDRMAEEISDRLKAHMSPAKIVEAFNDILYQRERFHPDNRRFYDPDNSFINRVIDRKTGIPITLSVVYLLVASRLDVPVAGVPMPGHFLVRYDGDSGSSPLFIDPFNYGAILRYEDCFRLLEAMGYRPEQKYLAPCTTRQMIERMLNNLVEAFSRNDQPSKADDIRSLSRILATDAYVAGG